MGSARTKKFDGRKFNRRFLPLAKLVAIWLGTVSAAAFAAPIFMFTPAGGTNIPNFTVNEGVSFDIDFTVKNVSLLDRTMRNVQNIAPTFFDGDVLDAVLSTAITADLCAGKTLATGASCHFTLHVVTGESRAHNIPDHDHGDWFTAAFVKYFDDARGIVDAEVAAATVRVVDLPEPTTLALVIAALVGLAGRRRV